MGPIWGRQGPDGPHVGPMNVVIWVICRWSVKFVSVSGEDVKLIRQVKQSIVKLVCLVQMYYMYDLWPTGDAKIVIEYKQYDTKEIICRIIAMALGHPRWYRCGEFKS